MTTLLQHMADSGVRTIAEWEHWIAVQHGAELTKCVLTKQDGGWRCMLKATYRGKHVVAFESAATLSGALYKAAFATSTKELTWLPDRYPPNVGGLTRVV